MRFNASADDCARRLPLSASAIALSSASTSVVISVMACPWSETLETIARAAGHDPLRHHPQEGRRAMTGQLDDVLAGIRPRRQHDRAQRLVDTLSALGIDDADPAKYV